MGVTVLGEPVLGSFPSVPLFQAVQSLAAGRELSFVRAFKFFAVIHIFHSYETQLCGV